MSGISLKNLKKVYPGDVEAIKDFSLEIKDKEFIVFVGPSGCGKSTILRMIAGLEEITEGELYIGDELVNDVLPKDRDIAMVFQNYALYPHMTVYKNLAFALELRHVPKDEIDKMVHETAKILELEKYLKRKPKALSGGQRQRVALGRAMVRNPKAFLLDEPLSNLDAKLRASTRTEISKLHKKLDTTFVYVTHDQTEAMTMADRIVVMKDGDIYQVGTPQELYDYPDNTFVAGFIGTPRMNFIPAKIIRDESNMFYVDLGEVRFALGNERFDPQVLLSYENKEVIMGVRSEDVLILDSNFSGPKIHSVVDVAEHMGSEIFVYIQYQETNIIVKHRVSRSFSMGEEIEFTFDMSKVHLFDSETEKSLMSLTD
ncbi:MAG: sn-glycerol-3-phosphate ABC transporter ATP-binding protein UgpC [Clostridiaceae bacterium]|nr:sn-glycerol-3-phosphate ABC transporter ATP-binding protein UgpC [Clostridiaceae bacterium]